VSTAAAVRSCDKTVCLIEEVVEPPGVDVPEVRAAYGG